MSYQRRPLAARAFDVALRLSNAFQNLPNLLTPPPFRLMQISSAYWQSRVLYVAARLDLATVLGDRLLTADHLAAEVGADPDGVKRLLRMLTAMGVFAEAKPGMFRNNRVSNGLRTDRRPNIRAMILMHNSQEVAGPWFEQLEAGIRGGGVPFELAHGREFYDFLDGDAEFDALFAEAMDAVEALVGDSFATEFDWRQVNRVIDVGGSKGAKSMAILKRHPHLSALVVDRAQAVAAGVGAWPGPEHAGCLPRMQFQAGDIFASVPPASGGRDAYLLSAVLHGFDDSTCAQVLRTVSAAAAPTDSPILLFEMVLPDTGAALPAAAMDMQMLVCTRGRERTMEEWLRVFDLGAVELTEVVDLASMGKMLVLRPRPAARA